MRQKTTKWQRQEKEVHWIAVHEEVLGSKLRGFRKRIKCSEAEALGILTLLWLWARKNADITGLLGNTDREDVSSALAPCIGSYLNANEVTEALIEEGWLDETNGQLYVHDWYEWQQYWYNYLEKKEKDKVRKRLEREKAKSDTHNKPDKDTSEGNPKKEKKPKKKQYADKVRMQPAEYEKLVKTYGKEFTDKLIEELDNYKAASGKKYAEDYRAILNWVVDKCEKKYPNLMKRQTSSNDTQDDGNPFESYK